jgi:hypothetical protein
MEITKTHIQKDGEWWSHRLVRTKRDIVNRAGETIPKGSVCSVHRGYGGLTLTSVLNGVFIRGVRFSDVELLERRRD